MTIPLLNKRILLGVTGSIAAYKSADLVRRLRDTQAQVHVVMTVNAQRFITPLTLQAVSGHSVHTDLFDLQAEAAMGHIEQARWADIILIAPASADFIARLAQGRANDLLTTLCLASQAPIVIAPAMNQQMWQNTATQHNLDILKQRGVHIFGPDQGSQACGEIGPGRMLEPAGIVSQLNQVAAINEQLANTHILITAGPTQEAIDPVRYVSNGSSGKMGYALAQAATNAGATVTLISGPVHLPRPRVHQFIPVISAMEMHAAVMANVAACDVFLAVAAVSDYHCQTIATQKIHKKHEPLTLQLAPTIDIVKTVGQLQNKPYIIGFAAETENMLESARHKRRNKNMDMIIANQIDHSFNPIGNNENKVTVITNNDEIPLALTEKTHLAHQLISIIAKHATRRKT